MGHSSSQRLMAQSSPRRHPPSTAKRPSQHRERLAREGVHIDDQSAPRPVGDPLDLGWAVELLLDQQNISTTPHADIE